jgi:Metallo-beta-lactamase superfamily
MAPDVAIAHTLISNAYLIGDAASWVLVDACTPGNERRIQHAAERRFGRSSRPRPILLTHGHFDHAGSAAPLADAWGVPIYAHSTQSAFRYWAFLSYSHRDEKWATWLHHALETCTGHKKLAPRERAGEPWPERLFPVFRDRDVLAGSADLPDRKHSWPGSACGSPATMSASTRCSRPKARKARTSSSTAGSRPAEVHRAEPDADCPVPPTRRPGR